MAADKNQLNRIRSPESRSFVAAGHRFTIEIHQLEGQEAWTLEILDAEGGSHVWNDEFSSDVDALKVAISVLSKVGADGTIDKMAPHKPRSQDDADDSDDYKSAIDKLERGRATLLTIGKFDAQD